VTELPAYRFFKIEDGHVVGPSEIVHCDDDAEAIRKAKRYADGYDVEVWDLARCVIRIDGSKKK